MNPPAAPSLSHYLAPLYRFAFLVTGDGGAAARVFDLTIEQAASRFSEFRCPRRAARWLFAEARNHCRRQTVAKNGSKPAAPSPPAALDAGEDSDDGDENGTGQIAAAFAPLPEPERCALALFYLFLFPSVELAEVLGVRQTELAAMLTRGRTLLRGHPAMAGLLNGADLTSC